MRKRYTAALLFLIFSNSNAQGTWNTATSLPAIGRAFSYVFSIGDTGYVCGGSNLATVQPEFWAYHPATDSWLQKTTPPFTSKQGVSFVINGKAYLCTGMKSGLTSPNSEVWEFDPVTGVWTQKNNFPGGARISAYSFANGNKGYIGGGSNTSPGGFLYDLWEYTPATDTWMQIPNYPIAEHFGLATFVENGLAYVVGGFGSAIVPVNKVWCFNPSNNQWTQKNNFPINLGQATGFTAGGSGYIVNGTTLLGSNQTKINDLYKYDSNTDTWSLQSPFPGAERSATHVIIVNNIVYAGHGLGLSAAYYADWYRYLPANVSVDEISNEDHFFLSPNPANDFVELMKTGKGKSIIIMDVNGRIVTEQEAANNRIDTSTLPNGLYIVKTENLHQRLIVQH